MIQPAADLHTVEQLCRLQLAARHLGCLVLVHDASPELLDLIRLAGLQGVLLADTQEPPGRRT